MLLLNILWTTKTGRTSLEEPIKNSLSSKLVDVFVSYEAWKFQYQYHYFDQSIPYPEQWALVTEVWNSKIDFNMEALSIQGDPLQTVEFPDMAKIFMKDQIEILQL